MPFSFSMPDFLICGAGKSGTSYIADVLNTHKDIFIPDFKEPAYFSTHTNSGNHNRGIDYYKSIFSNKNDEKISGEASTVYMYDPNSPKLIKKHIPKVKLIFILRNPTKRIYSNYWQDIKSGLRLPSFDKLVLEKHERLFEYVEASLYHKHINRYLNTFNRKQIHIIKYEHLFTHKENLFINLMEFLEINTTIDDIRLDFTSNSSAKPKSSKIARLLRNNHLNKISHELIPSHLKPHFKLLLTYARKKNQTITQYPSMKKNIQYNIYKLIEKDIETLKPLVDFDISDWEVEINEE